MLKFGNKFKDRLNSNQVDMFGNDSDIAIKSPLPANIEEWKTMSLLSKEKEVVGIYLSGHPLDDYKLEIDSFCRSNLSMLENLKNIKEKKLSFAGVVTNIEHRETKSGKPFGILYLEDYKGSYSFYLFGDDYISFKSYLTVGWLLQVSGQIKKIL